MAAGTKVDSATFRSVLGRFATGVTVVGVRHSGGIHGMTANAFSSVSLDPPLVLVCVDKRARSHQYLLESGAFAVSVLAESQKEISDRFAGRHAGVTDLFEGIAHRQEVTGSPILQGAISWLDCRLVAAHEAGDHTIFVGEVIAAGLGPEEPPLLYFASRYRSMAAGAR